MTEDARAEQWRLLSQFSYEPYIERYFASRSRGKPDTRTVEYISGCIRQADAYYRAGTTAPLDISPLLLYYGSTTLLLGAAALTTGTIPSIGRHGMDIRRDAGATRLADVIIVPSASPAGGLSYLASVYSPGCRFVGGVPWTMEETLASIPDLFDDFVGFYQESNAYVIPLEVVRNRGVRLDRVSKRHLGSWKVDTVFSHVPGFSDAYLQVQSLGGDYLFLYRRLGGADIGKYSLLGRRFLEVGHEKGTQLIAPGQIVSMVMALFALGHLSRYSPEWWNPFTYRNDSGERSLVEKLLAVSARFIPNLALNYLYDERLQFVSDVVSTEDSSIIDREAVREMIREEMGEK